MTTGYRNLLRIGWAGIAVAIYFAAAAAVLDSAGAWWIVIGLALGVMMLAGALPEPLPRDLITGSRNWVLNEQEQPRVAGAGR